MSLTRASYLSVLTLSALGAVTGGCATKGFVRENVATVNTRVDGVQTSVEQTQQRLSEHDTRISEQKGQIETTSRTAQDALNRALEAGKLAEGKFLFEVVMSDADVRFPFDRAELSDEGRRHLDELAQRLKQDDRNVFIEIQGHTDWVGPKEYNEQLGEERAEAVRLYLNREHALPLHRMSVISYGESVPAADNRNRDGRAQNRRVVLVVLS